METRQGEKSGCEQIGVNNDPLVVDTEIFPALAKNKDTTEKNCQPQQTAKPEVPPRPQLFFREQDGQAAGQKTDREQAGFMRVQGARG